MTVDVRPVRPAEHAEAGRVTRAAFAALYADGGRDDYLDAAADVAGRAGRTTVLVAVEDGRILGSITVELETKVDADRQLEPGEAHLRLLGVAPEAQGRGVGRRLMEAAAALARAAGKRRLTLGTMPENTAARHLYERLGYLSRGRVEFAPGRWAVAYELPLDKPVAGSSTAEAPG
ncbi:MAG: GNAT family N-acetyltransferase [Candidatus Dormibacteria bacterium]|jgi:ribosomal protein S18 acetylase RimI-like enzyme